MIQIIIIIDAAANGFTFLASHILCITENNGPFWYAKCQGNLSTKLLLV